MLRVTQAVRSGDFSSVWRFGLSLNQVPAAEVASPDST